MKKTLLIVDDEKLVCEKLKTILPWREYGFVNVLCSSDSLQAIEMIDSHKPEMIITDICMPVKDGLEIVGYVRNKRMTSYIILISAYDEFEYAQKAIDLGVQAYLLKPVSAEILKSKVSLYSSGLSEAAPRSAGIDKKNQLKKSIDDYLASNLHEKITLNDMARLFYFTPPYFSQLFTQLYGMPFTDYITKLKIDMANHYLVNSQYKITYIADMLGFKDYRYFIRLFEKHNGCSPLQYRKNHAQAID